MHQEKSDDACRSGHGKELSIERGVNSIVQTSERVVIVAMTGLLKEEVSREM